MSVIFISYANEAMAYSLKRIGRQAKRLGVFDEVQTYTPADLPEYAKSSPLMASPRGAGYWFWKPVMIKETLDSHKPGDIVVYVDAGCTLRRSEDWRKYLEIMKEYDTLCFQYSPEHPEWEKWGSGSSILAYWTKKQTLDWLDNYLGDKSFHEVPQIWGGLIFMKNRDNTLLGEWLKIMLEHPELISDPSDGEPQNEGFAGHRHDQCIITPLAISDPTVKVLPEVSERYSRNSFCWASRVRARDWKEYISVQIKHYSRIWLGDNSFEKVKSILKF